MVALDETPTVPSEQNRLELSLDPEHSGIRVAGCGTFIGGTIFSFLLFSLFTSTAIIPAILSLFSGAVIANIIDRYLKQSWPSGRLFVADAGTIAIRKHNQVEGQIDPQAHVNVLSWRFEVPRSGRVKKGWFVLGLALEQDGNYLTVYSFASPDEYQQWDDGERFKFLDRTAGRKKKTESIREMKRTGEQRRLIEAELERGLNGGELPLEQFQELVAYLQTHYPRWMND